MRNLFLITLFLTCSLKPLQGQSTIDHSVLAEIKKKAKETHSDAVIILQKGELIYEDYFGQEEKPIYISSAGKSLLSLAIGKLLDKKLLDSLDQPVHTIFSQWKQGRKKEITVRMLLNHTSGIQNELNASIELEPAPDYKVDNIIELALSAELSHIPGETQMYNNKATALLGGIVQKLSGKRFDHFFLDEFYKPMGISHYDWIKDRAGNPTTHGAFVIKPSDFLKFGSLMLNEGVYNGKRIIPNTWIQESLKQGHDLSPYWGLLWWRLPKYEKRIIDEDIWTSWKEADVDQGFLNKMQALKAKMFESKYEFYEALEEKLGPNWNAILKQKLPPPLLSSKRIYSDKVVAYYADGYRGNYLVIVPASDIIAVRCADHDGFNYATDTFADFVDLVSRLGD